MSKMYKCSNWCGHSFPIEEWQRASEEAASENGDPLPPGWEFESADPGDTVVCPGCGADDERSEIEEA